jgi:hypothetical protein
MPVDTQFHVQVAICGISILDHKGYTILFLEIVRGVIHNLQVFAEAS